jgi:WD40 repeat protein
MHATLSLLPNDALAEICARLSVRDVRALCSTCKLFQELWEKESFWATIVRVRFKCGHVPLVPPVRITRGHHSRRTAQLADVAENLWCVSAIPVQRLAFAGTGQGTGLATGPGGSLISVSSSCIRFWKNGRWLSNSYHGYRAYDRTVTAINFDCRSGRVALGGLDKAVAVHDLSDPNLPSGKLLRGHSRAVCSVLFLNDGHSEAGHQSIIASGGEDTTIRLHHVATRRGLGVFRGHGSAVVWLGGAERGRKLLSQGSSDARVKLWDVEAGLCLATVRCAEAITETVVDTGDGDTVYIASGQVVKVVDLRCAASTAAILSLPRTWRNCGPIRTLALRADGMLAAGVGGGAVAIWDATGPWEARGVGWPGCGGHRARKSVRAVLLSSQSVIVGCADGRVATLALDGYNGYDETLSAASKLTASVRLLALDSSNNVLAVGRDDGSLEAFDMKHESTVVDWEKAARVCGMESRVGYTGESKFWIAANSPSMHRR